MFTYQSGATSAMGPAIGQEAFAKHTTSRWRKKHSLSATASFEECVEAAIEHCLEPAVEEFVQKIVSSTNASRKALDKIIDDISEDPVT